MWEREKKIREYRLKQPLEELKRKRDKSVERANIWSQEELDYASAKARKMAEATKWAEQ